MALIPGTPEFEVYQSLAGDQHGRWLERLGTADLEALVDRMGVEFRHAAPVAKDFRIRHGISGIML